MFYTLKVEWDDGDKSIVIGNDENDNDKENNIIPFTWILLATPVQNPSKCSQKYILKEKFLKILQS